MFNVVRFNNSSVLISFVNIRKVNFLNVASLIEKVSEIFSGYCRNVFLNLENIVFIDSKAFEGLMYINELANEHGVDFSCCNVSDELHELFDLIGDEYSIRVSSGKEIQVQYLVEA